MWKTTRSSGAGRGRGRAGGGLPGPARGVAWSRPCLAPCCPLHLHACMLCMPLRRTLGALLARCGCAAAQGAGRPGAGGCAQGDHREGRGRGQAQGGRPGERCSAAEHRPGSAPALATCRQLAAAGRPAAASLAMGRAWGSGRPAAAASHLPFRAWQSPPNTTTLTCSPGLPAPHLPGARVQRGAGLHAHRARRRRPPTALRPGQGGAHAARHGAGRGRCACCVGGGEGAVHCVHLRCVHPRLEGWRGRRQAGQLAAAGGPFSIHWPLDHAAR